MGFSVKVGPYTFEAIDYRVNEAATPLAAGDSSGSTGTIEFTIPEAKLDDFPHPPQIESEVWGDRTYGDGIWGYTSGGVMPSPRDTGWYKVALLGPQFLIGMPVRLADSRKGFVVGEVLKVARTDQGGHLILTCTTRLGKLNVYGVQAQPFVGTLGAAFEYYLSLADITTDLFVDETIYHRPVVFRGWSGELWYHLKEMAAAQDCDVSLVSGIILLRPIRARVATRGRDVDRSQESGGGTLAQGVEVYRYDSYPITNELVYPPGGWTPETEVMNVNAGEDAEYDLELSASVSSIEQPVMQTFVAESYGSSSVYTVVANDGLPVSSAAWSRNGGRLEVSINPDTTSLHVKLHGPTGLTTTSGGPATNFSIALASDTTGNRYSTFRIVGTGVAFNREKRYIRTGVPASKTATEVGVTIDNVFINTIDDLYRAGTRAAKQFAGQSPSLSGTVTSINRLGDSGTADYPTYGEVRNLLNDELGAPTYGQVQSYVEARSATYGNDRTYWFSFVRDSAVNQVFGNVQGCRVFDKRTRRWYRIRTGTLTPPNIQQFTADDDLTHADMEEYFALKGYTYGDVQATRTGLTYLQDDMAAMYG